MFNLFFPVFHTKFIFPVFCSYFFNQRTQVVELAI